MNIKIKNQYGGVSQPTCERHLPKVQACIFGDLTFHETAEPCTECAREQFELERPARIREAFKSPNFAYARRNRWGSVSIYHRNSGSPTGVLSAGGCSIEEYNTIMRENELGRKVPLYGVVEFGERR